MNFWYFKLLIVSIIVSTLFGCKNTLETASNERYSVSKTITTDSFSITLDDETNIYFPENVFDEDVIVTFSIDTIDNKGWELRSDITAVSNIISITTDPKVTTLNQPVTITIPLNNDQINIDLLTTFHLHNEIPYPIDFEIDNDFITITVNQFSEYVIVEDKGKAINFNDVDAIEINTLFDFSSSMPSSLLSYDRDAGLFQLGNKTYWGISDIPSSIPNQASMGNALYCAAKENGEIRSATDYASKMDAILGFRYSNESTDINSLNLNFDVFVNTDQGDDIFSGYLNCDWFSFDISLWGGDSNWFNVNLSTGKLIEHQVRKKNTISQTDGEWIHVSLDLKDAFEDLNYLDSDLWGNEEYPSAYFRFRFHSDDYVINNTQYPSGAYIDNLELVVSRDNIEEDTTPPIISLIGESTLSVNQWDIYSDAGATALDDVDGNITDSISVNNPVDTSVIGEYTITYNVSDSEGNPAIQVTRIINVVEVVEEDTTPPIISLVGESTLSVNQWDIYSDAGATALDDVDGNITDSISVNNPVDTSVIGEYTITYNVSDSEGNPAIQVTRIINVVEVVEEDTTPPAEVNNLTAFSGEEEITLSWTKPSETDFENCEIYYGINIANILYEGEINYWGTTVSNLTNGTEYIFIVKTYDNAGNFSNGISITKKCIKEYRVGEIGPAGGYIFYDDESDGHESYPNIRYLEAAPEDLESIIWGTMDNLTNADGTFMGEGYQNTLDIISKDSSILSAAFLCSQYSIVKDDVTYNDWFLPSRTELIHMNDNLYSPGRGNFKQFGYYWSSTEEDKDNGLLIAFYNSTFYYDLKSNSHSVRAIRAF